MRTLTNSLIDSGKLEGGMNEKLKKMKELING